MHKQPRNQIKCINIQIKAYLYLIFAYECAIVDLSKKPVDLTRMKRAVNENQDLQIWWEMTGTAEIAGKKRRKLL